MAYTVGTCEANMQRLLAGRVLSTNDMQDWIRKAVLELTENYKFAELQATGPKVNLSTGVAVYSPSFFLQPGDATLDIKKVDSFFVYYNPAVSTVGQFANPGIPLKFRTIDVMEMEINILGQPMHWTRHEGLIYIGFSPRTSYLCYMRYQKEHPFPTGTASDVILLPNSWQEIVEYAAAMRAANELRLFDIATGYHNAIYGDPKFQLTGGTEGTPGLIFHRTSQEERDQTTSTKAMRLRMS